MDTVRSQRPTNIVETMASKDAHPNEMISTSGDQVVKSSQLQQQQQQFRGTSDSPKRLLQLGTPFVSRPNLNQSYLSPIDVQNQENTELDRVKKELEQKEMELREAMKIIEEIKEKANAIPKIVISSENQSLKNGGDLVIKTKQYVEKVYYETPRSVKGEELKEEEPVSKDTPKSAEMIRTSLSPSKL